MKFCLSNPDSLQIYLFSLHLTIRLPMSAPALTFSRRSYQAEIMDDFSIGGEAIRITIEELNFINKWLGGDNVTRSGIEKLLHKIPKSQEVTLADLGCGSGETLRKIRKWMQTDDRHAQLTGIDANPHIIDYAHRHTPQFENITFENLNVFSPEFASQPYDIITCVLFCHHFTDDELIALFKSLRQQARLGIVINDLHRHRFAYHSISWLTRLFSKSYLVRNDARLSVLRSFRRKDLENIFRQAGIENYQISWHWAFRWRIVIFQ
jgi:2-polyprenyl-3-methyl-5-hydroxy-6-metoxy-1,4-benzoquinol methylase